jgi:uncharacterized cupredoxin-like copper-binding protein
MKRSFASLFIALVVILAACSNGGSSSSPRASSQSSSMGGMGNFADAGFGRPGDPMSVDRTVAVELLDALAFDPSSLEVAPGQTVRFRVTNAGVIDHEFVVGDEATQVEHEAEMGSEGSMQMSEPNMLTLKPGETRSMVWRFTEPGIVLYGCHIPGHYPAGMVGTIMVMDT